VDSGETPSVGVPKWCSRPQILLAALLLVAGALRGLYLWDNLTHNPFSQLLVLDSAHYDLWAVDIAEGDWLGEDVFLQAPFYPYLLGVLYALVGRHLWLVYLLQHALGLVNVYLVWRLGRRWFDDRVALVGTALFALYGFAAFVEGKLLVETLYLTWSLLSLHLAGEVAEQGRWRQTALLGLVLGLASVTRANGLALVVLVAVWLVWVLRRRGVAAGLGRAALVVAVAAAVVAPVTVRNWVVGKCFVPIGAGGGLAFARSNVLGGRGGFEPVAELPDSVVGSPREISELAEAELGRTPTAREVSAFWTRRTLLKMRERPGAWLCLEGWKALRFLDNYEHGTTNALSEERTLTPVLQALFVPAGVILALGIVGLVAGLREAGRRSLLYLYVVMLVAGILVFAMVARYRLPMMPVLALFAAQAMVTTCESARKGRWRRCLAVLLPTAVVLVVSLWQPNHVYRRQRIRVWLNLAAVQLLSDQPEQAIDTANDILGLDENVGRAYLLRAHGFLALKHRREAEVDLRKALELMPDDPGPPQLLAVLLVEGGRPAEALPIAQEATRVVPENAFAWSTVGGSYLELGRSAEAEEAFRQALALDPGLVSARLGLAHTLFDTDRFPEALAEYRRLRPEDLSQRARSLVAERIRACEARSRTHP